MKLRPAQLEALLTDWQIWARDTQLPPLSTPGHPWRTWLFLGGRGAGKTRAGAEWVRAIATGADIAVDPGDPVETRTRDSLPPCGGGLGWGGIPELSFSAPLSRLQSRP